MRPLRLRLRELVEGHKDYRSIRQLSEVIGVDHQTALYWNQGRSIPNLMMVNVVMETLGCTYEELVTSNPFI